MIKTDIAPYLAPYHRAAGRYGGDFGALCWTSLNEQITRFDAMVRLYDFVDTCVVDAGCGRADFFDFLIEKGIKPLHYIGIEAIRPLIDRAHSKTCSTLTVIHSDFVASGLATGYEPDVITFSGSLNTLKTKSLKHVLNSAINVARHAVVFNFLSSPEKAGAPWLAWHTKEEILALLEDTPCEVRFFDGYLDGDITAIAKRTHSPP